MLDNFLLPVYLPQRFYERIKAEKLLNRTFREKNAAIGPFFGELGHLLGHVLPFVNYLYANGIQVYILTLNIYKPFFVDSNGNFIVKKFIGVEDSFSSKTPKANKVFRFDYDQNEMNDFDVISRNMPCWNLAVHKFYWHTFRWWVAEKGYCKMPNFVDYYKTSNEDSAVVFPRKKGSSYTKSNGEVWNYNKVIDLLLKYFSKVYVLGHPSLSGEVAIRENVEILISLDNERLIHKCANSKLIVNQHSGTNYLGKYTNSPVLILYKGKGPIAGIEQTIFFNRILDPTWESFNYAFSFDDIEDYLSKQNK